MGSEMALSHGQGREDEAISKVPSGPSQAAEASWLVLINDCYKQQITQTRPGLQQGLSLPQGIPAKGTQVVGFGH